MARDPEFYELAEKLPGACMALLGLPGSIRYRGEAVDIKRSSRRVDVILRPVSARSAAPIYVVELWRSADPDGDRTLLRKALDVAEQRGVDRSRVRAVAVYVTRREARGVLPADVGEPGDPTIRFTPRRIVLRDIEPGELLRRGGVALAALPLVGSDDEVLAKAADWRRGLRDTATLGVRERTQALGVFLTLLADRFKGTDLSEILGKEGHMPLEKTATGRAMIKRGEARGEARGKAIGKAAGAIEALQGAFEASVRDRFRRFPRAISSKLKAIDDRQRLTALVVEVGRAASLEEVAALLEVPAR
jgi:hypothetical protein